MTRLSANPWPTENGVYPELLNEACHEAYARGVGEEGWLKMAVLPDGVHEILMQDFVIHWRGKRWVIPAGFVTDYASVPRFFHRVLPQRGRYSVIAVFHDYLYWSGLVTRAEADCVFLELGARMKVREFDQFLLYSGVRIGGWVAYNNYRRQQEARRGKRGEV